MTPERAAEIAGGLRFQYAMSNAAHDAIKAAILRACAEEREACAKIADEMGGYEKKGHEIAAAIRDQGNTTPLRTSRFSSADEDERNMMQMLDSGDSEWRREKTAQQNIESLLAKILELQKDNELLRSAKPNMTTSMVKMARQLEEYEKFLERNGMQKDTAIRGGG